MIAEEIYKIAQEIPAQLKEKKGLFSLEFTIAERKVFLSKKKLAYSAKFRIDENKKEVRFTEMLKETGSGLSSGGDMEMSPGFGFKTETYKNRLGPREGTIKEQSELFGKQYSYTFNFSQIRGMVEREAVKDGYTFKYQLTSAGL